jgi:septal ring factor EnvC (AmiA/AmiB activator)
MIVRLSCAGLMMISLCFFASAASAQDIPGIEICTAEKTMERRTSCLQSNINFQQKTIAKITADYQQRIDTAKAQIEALRATLASLQKTVDELKSAQAKQAEDLKKKADASAAKEGTTAKDTGN